MPLEYPHQDYFPSCKIRLIIRLDELGNPDLLRKKVPKKTTKNLKGVKDERRPLKVIEDPDSAPGVTQFLLTSNAPSTGGAGTAQTQSEDNLTHEIGGIIPRSATWKQNSIRIPDTLSLTLKWEDMPIDPFVVRSCAVEFYLGTVRAQDYGAGVLGQSREHVNDIRSIGEPLHLVPDEYVDEQGRLRSNLRFQGWVDKWEVTHSGDSESLHKMECTDNTRLLIKQEAPSKLQISVDENRPIDEAVAEYLTHFPQFEGLTVAYRPSVLSTFRKTNVPVLGKALGPLAKVPGLGGAPQGKGGGGNEKLAVWDYLTDIVGSLGHLIRVDGTTIIIQQAKTLLNSKATPREEDPYQEPRRLQGREYPIRTFLYGRNVLEMRRSRELGNEPKNLEIRAYNPVRKNTIVARSPQDAAKRVASATPGDGKEDQNWNVQRVTAIIDQKTLQDVADNAYEMLNRTQLLIEIKTKNLASFGGGNEDPDLLDMKPGDSLEVGIVRDKTQSVLGLEERLTIAEEGVQAMADRGFSPGFQTAYVRAYGDAGFPRVFRVREVQSDWDVDQGVGISVSCATYSTAVVDEPSVEGTPKK